MNKLKFRDLFTFATPFYLSERRIMFMIKTNSTQSDWRKCLKDRIKKRKNISYKDKNIMYIDPGIDDIRVSIIYPNKEEAYCHTFKNALILKDLILPLCQKHNVGMVFTCMDGIGIGILDNIAPCLQDSNIDLIPYRSRSLFLC